VGVLNLFTDELKEVLRVPAAHEGGNDDSKSLDWLDKFIAVKDATGVSVYKNSQSHEGDLMRLNLARHLTPLIFKTPNMSWCPQ